MIYPSYGEVVGPEIADRGLPQGSPLSPLLFNMYCNFVRDFEIEGCNAVVCNGPDMAYSINNAN